MDVTGFWDFGFSGDGFWEIRAVNGDSKLFSKFFGFFSVDVHRVLSLFLSDELF